MQVISSTDFQDWKKHPVTLMLMSAVNTRIEDAKDIMEFIPDGGIKRWLNTFISNPYKGLKELIMGKKYSSGDYALGEIFMRNILGQFEIQNRGQVPDGVVPQAWDFFTAALGVRIGSGDHLNELVKSPGAYFEWGKGAFDDVTAEQAQRATGILRKLGYPANQLDSRRNSKWNLDLFLSEPYIFPLPGAPVGMRYNGHHPILDLDFQEGLPINADGTVMTTLPTDRLQAGLFAGEFFKKNPVITALLIAGGIYTVYQFTKKQKSRY